MGVHVYCVVPAGFGPPDGTRGIEGEAVGFGDAGMVGCWMSRHDSRPAPTAESIRVHNDVVKAGMTDDVTPVPLRFGQWFADADTAVAEVGSDAERWRSLLAGFAGFVEYGIRVRYAMAAPAVSAVRVVRPGPLTSGTAYMAALAKREADAADRRRDAERAAAWIAGRTSAIVRDSRWEAGRGVDVVAVAHLVARADTGAYRSAVESLRAERPEVSVMLTGPWPPWSFVA
ncbi:MAG TPA: GvpL/GvpF family gas vesicle protein [Longimicrobiales bacterium]|nr:GvpL/GvpF family gas vesicle protein [Longimicrobiales bacterium]